MTKVDKSQCQLAAPQMYSSVFPSKTLNKQDHTTKYEPWKKKFPQKYSTWSERQKYSQALTNGKLEAILYTAVMLKPSKVKSSLIMNDKNSRSND